MINKDDFISIEENIQKKIIKERQEDYGDYEENFALLAEMFSIIFTFISVYWNSHFISV